MNSILNNLWQHCPITIPNNSNQIQIDYSFKFHRPPKKKKNLEVLPAFQSDRFISL